MIYAANRFMKHVLNKWLEQDLSVSQNDTVLYEVSVVKKE